LYKFFSSVAKSGFGAIIKCVLLQIVPLRFQQFTLDHAARMTYEQLLSGREMQAPYSCPGIMIDPIYHCTKVSDE
jgi:hypothetical protein